MFQRYPQKMNLDIYGHEINTNPDCLFLLSFGFFNRSNRRLDNPYSLAPIPSTNLYSGKYGVWSFCLNLRLRCRTESGSCNENILFARKLHAELQNSSIWQTHPLYFNGSNDRGVDFSAEYKDKILYIIKEKHNMKYNEMSDWLKRNFIQYNLDIKIKEIEVLPDGSVDLVEWYLINTQSLILLNSFQAYITNKSLFSIPNTLY